MRDIQGTTLGTTYFNKDVPSRPPMWCSCRRLPLHPLPYKPRATVQSGHAHDEEVAVKLYVDTTGKQITVSKDPTERVDQNNRQRTERETGRLMWSTQVFVLDADGGEVITVHTAGEKP